MQPYTSTAAQDSHRWRALALLALAELLAMSLWFAGSAAAPQLRELFDLSAAQTGWLTTSVQLGFVVGTACAAIFNLADVISSRLYFAAAAILGAMCNCALLLIPEFSVALATRFLVGLSLAGVYPPAMKMISTWFLDRRGLAIGTIVGALTVGKAGPYLIHALGGVTIEIILVTASASAVVAAVLVYAGYTDGPYAFPRRTFSWSLAALVVRQREWRSVTLGYLGHMWELYAFWTWITAYFVASMAERASLGLPVPSPGFTELLAFGAIAVGGAGAVAGGWLADRIGQAKLVIAAMAISGSCALLIGLTFGAAPWLLAAVGCVWGISVIADSAQFSTLVTRSVPQHAVGTALTLQTSLGFLLTMASIQLIARLAELTGWRWAFSPLSIGPALGILAIVGLLRSLRARNAGSN
jgi:MFS family permease